MLAAMKWVLVFTVVVGAAAAANAAVPSPQATATSKSAANTVAPVTAPSASGKSAASNGAASKPSAAASKPGMAELAGQGPLDFRCDNMQVFSKPNRTLCRGNVVMRRSDILVCCVQFEGVADERWQWEKLVCNEDVRAQRGDEILWADKAELMPKSSDVVLTGRPVVRRAESVIEGERITVNASEDRARVDKPRGHFGPNDFKVSTKPAPPAAAAPAPLPGTCPVPGAPASRRAPAPATSGSR